MKVFTCLVLVTIFANTYSIPQQNTQNSNDNQRSVNLALETVLEFNNKDNSADLQFLDNVQNFITKVKTVLGKNKNLRRDFRAASDVEKFTDFVQEFIAILNTYSDADFLDIYDIIYEEFQKYHYRGCKFYELTENYEMRKELTTKLELLRNQPVYAMKAYINLLSKILKEEKYESYVHDLLDYINSLYREDAREKFMKILSDFENLYKTKDKKSTTDVVKVIRDAIRSIIFDHYTYLNRNARRELKTKLEKFWKKYNQPPLTVPIISNDTNIKNIKSETIPEIIDIKKSVTVANRDPKTVVTKKEEIKNTENKKSETTSDMTRIEIKHSDFKVLPIMRDGIHGTKLRESKNEKNKAKKLRNAQKEVNVDSRDIDKSIKTSKKDKNYEPTTKKISTNNFLRTFSSDEHITGETFEDNSIEFEQEEQALIENAPQRYITLYPESIILEPRPKKKADKVIHRSKKINTLPKVATLWVEESTGRMPGAPREKLTSKAPHKAKPKSEHKSHHKKHNSDKKSKESSHKHKTDKHKKNKHVKDEHSNLRTKKKKKKKAAMMSENNAYIDVKGSATDKYEYKKMMQVVKLPKYDPTAPLTEPTLSLITKIKKITSAPIKYVKRNPLLPLNKLRSFRKFVNANSKEGISKERFYYVRKNGSFRKNNKNDTVGTATADQDVMKRIKELERELKNVKSQMKDVNIDEVNVREDKHEPIEARAKEDTAPKELKLNQDKFNFKPEKGIEYKTEKKETKYNEKKDDYVVRAETSTVDKKLDKNNEKVPKDITSKNDGTETKLGNDKYKEEFQKNIKAPDNKKVKFMYGEKPEEIKMHDLTGNNIYDDIDEWKDAFKSRMKFTKPTITSTLKTTTQTETTPESSTDKHKEESTIPTKVELFIPVSMPPQMMSSSKPTNEIRKDVKKLNVEKETISRIPNNSPLVKQVDNQELNVSSSSKNKGIESEILYMFKKNNITIPNENNVHNIQETVDNPGLSATNLLDKIPSPVLNDYGNDSVPIPFTDPFKGDEEMHFLREF